MLPTPIRTLILLLVACFLPTLVFGQEAAAAEAAAPAVAAALPAAAASQEAAMAAQSTMRTGLDTVWVLVTAALVFWMNAGFALVESGLCQAKNCANILAKNFIVFAISTVSYWVLGWGLMFGDGNGFVGLNGLWFVSGADNSPALGEAFMAANPFSSVKYEGVYGAINWTPVPLAAKFFFQLVFAGTAATIVSGAVAERIKFGAFVAFSFVLVGLIYPVCGHWIWGGGTLGANNFRDFAGSTVVHSVGGWAALAGVIVLGPRLGKYLPNGRIRPIPGHSMTSAALGVLILWLGWFGFNPGSTMSAGNGHAIAHVLVNTNLGGAFGAVGAMFTSWFLMRKPDVSMILNGCLAGLVAVTANCAFTTAFAAALIGTIGGVLVVLAVSFFDKIKLDDPVGALSVHLVNGVWGTLALGLFYDEKIATEVAGLATGLSRMDQTLVQLKGIGLVGVFAFFGSVAVWSVLKVFGGHSGIRVTPEEEAEGLDIGEHGNEAYPDFEPSYSVLKTPQPPYVPPTPAPKRPVSHTNNEPPALVS